GTADNAEFRQNNGGSTWLATGSTRYIRQDRGDTAASCHSARSRALSKQGRARTGKRTPLLHPDIRSRGKYRGAQQCERDQEPGVARLFRTPCSASTPRL